jgi:hypothetical protein
VPFELEELTDVTVGWTFSWTKLPSDVQVETLPAISVVFAYMAVVALAVTDALIETDVLPGLVTAMDIDALQAPSE